MILVASLSLTPGSIFSSAAVARLMSTASIFDATAVLRASEGGAFGAGERRRRARRCRRERQFRQSCRSAWSDTRGSAAPWRASPGIGAGERVRECRLKELQMPDLGQIKHGEQGVRDSGGGSPRGRLAVKFLAVGNRVSYLPMQKSRKITSRRSSTSTAPVMRPRLRSARRRSSARNSGNRAENDRRNDAAASSSAWR